MNEFDLIIKQSKRSHFKYKIIGGFVVSLAAICLTLWLFVVKGYTIIIEPGAARINTTLSIKEGIGFIVDDKLYTLSSSTELLAKAQSYLPHSEIITTASETTINILLRPKPGRIIAESVPSSEDNAWYLNDELIHVGNHLNIEVKHGQYSLNLNSPYHHLVSETIDIDIAEEKKFQFELTPVSGQIDISSRPDGARVILDDVVLGYTPLVINRSGGEYKIQIDKSGYEPIEDAIQITNKDKNAKRNYLLALRTAILTLDLHPTGGVLLIDGEKINKTDRLSVTANQKHNILYQKPGYYSYKNTVRLAPGNKKHISINLKQEFGSVILKSTPEAEVFINNKSLGFTPVVADFPSVEHRIQFRKTGYRTVKKRMTPSSKNPTTVNVALMTEYDARRKDGKPTIAETLGIKMVRFKPQKIRMGARANEKGRRRNEILRDVVFSRPIYVSRHEISEALYSKFRGGGTNSNLPVSDISWSEAVQFCNWLSKQEGLPLFYNFSNGRYHGFNQQSSGYRLPTEAEWEWLARRARRAEETVYVWGNSERIPKDAGNLADESVKGKKTFYIKKYNDGYVGKAPVGSFKADRAGLYDLAGNVSEWVHDIYVSVPRVNNQLLQDPMGPGKGTLFFYKGANYNSGRMSELRAAYREPASNKDKVIGFRIARYE